MESAKLQAAPYSSLIRTCAPYPSSIRTCAPTCLRVFTLTNKRLTRLFLSCLVVSIVKYYLRLKNPRKATAPDFIHLKVIKFASNVIDSHLYNIIIKDLEKNKYSEEPKTLLSLLIYFKLTKSVKTLQKIITSQVAIPYLIC